MLGNVLYIGKIRHRGVVYDGMHDGIIEPALWDAVQAHLGRHRYRERVSTRAKHPSILAGLVRDDRGRKMGITHTQNKSIRHRYYRSLLKPGEDKSSRFNVPAVILEKAAVNLLVRILRDRAWITATSDPIANSVEMTLWADRFADELETGDVIAKGGVITTLVKEMRIGSDHLDIDLVVSHLAEIPGEKEMVATIREPVRFEQRGQELKLVIPASGPPEPEPDPALIKAVGQAHRWWRDLTSGRYSTLREIAEAYDTDERYAAFVLRLAFLSPELTERILAGTQPFGLTLHRLLWKIDLPISWEDQRKMADAIP